jgi:hypothetical protein
MLKIREASHVAARPSQARNQAQVDRIGDVYKHDRQGLGRFFQHQRHLCGARHDHVRNKAHNLGRVGANTFGIDGRPTIVEMDVASFDPSQLLKPLAERGDPCLRYWIALSITHQYSDPPHPLGLLRARGERPCRRRAAEKREELAPPHSITSSARASSEGGTSRPSAFAVIRLMTSSNLFGCSTGI